MNIDKARCLLAELPEGAKVLDVGGGASPFPRANWVIDALRFEALGGGSHGNVHLALGDVPRRYSADTWVTWDLCSRQPWPFEDKQFDFAVCSHLLEDIRDPIWVCSELSRVAKAGYVESPSRIVEQSTGVENPRHCGYYHHRWIINRVGDRLEFRMKPHCLNSFREAWVARLRPWEQINPKYEIVTLDWQGEIDATEVLEFSEERVIDELRDFALASRGLADLVVRRPMDGLTRLKRRLYYFRLSRGLR
jgi:hypothetical protein